MADLLLSADCLFSKFGFHDGDVMFDWVWDAVDAGRLDEPSKKVDDHGLLRALVRKHLLPLIPGDFTVYDIETNHNPIRVGTWRGAEWDRYARHAPPEVGEIFVSVPHDEVVAVLRSLERKP